MSRTTTVDTVPAGEVSVAGASRPDPFIKRGTPQFMRVTLALFSAGLATFALLYCVQPILPVLSNEFGVSPASSSISLSISTAMLAVGLLFTGPLSDAIGRKPVMVTALLLAACCSLLSTMMTSWHGILIMRALIGLSLSGVAAVGMTYLSEEIHPSVVAFSMGLYISGNSIGGMSGRLLSGVFTDFFSWRIALAVIGCFALASALMFWKILPESRHFRPTSLRPKTLYINFRLHWRDKGLPRLFLMGFLLMGAFVTLFNYIGYRLMLSPWHLNQAVVGLLSVAYLTGTWSSPKAGLMTARFGRGPVMVGFLGLMLADDSLSSVLTRCRRTGIRLRRLLLGLIFLLAAFLGIGEQITRARLVHASRLHGQRQLFERMLFGELTLLSDGDHGIRQDGLRAERTRRSWRE